eukprot:g2794.t1
MAAKQASTSSRHSRLHQQPVFNQPPKHYRGVLDKTRMSGNPQLDYDLPNGKPKRPEDFMYQTYTRNKLGKGVASGSGSTRGVGSALQMYKDATNYHLVVEKMKAAGPAAEDPATRRHWELQSGLKQYGNELNVNLGEVPWPEGVERKARDPCRPREQHFAYTTTSNNYGIKAHTAADREESARLGNKFTDSFNGFKFVDGGMR